MNEKKNIWTNPLLKSAIKSDKVTAPEILIGYLIGPFGALLSSGIFTSMLQKYLNEVLGLSNSFLTALPLVSTIFIIIAKLAISLIFLLKMQAQN